LNKKEDTALFSKIEKIKKAELHVHLRGSITPKVFDHLCSKYGVQKSFNNKFSEDLKTMFLEVDSIREFIEKDRPGSKMLFEFSGYLDFLKTYLFTSAFFRDKDDLEFLAVQTYKNLISQNVIYAEITISVYEYVEMGISYQDIFEVLKKVTKEAQKDGLYLNWIVDLVRNFGANKCLEILNEVVDQKYPRVVGITLGGNERDFPPEMFLEVYEKAKAAGLKCTIHTGEGLGSESVSWVLDNIKPERLGHGVRAVEDKAVFDKAVRAKTVFEVCPTSNVLLGLYPEIAAHPAKKMLDSGAILTISTDDPGFFQVNLNEELSNLEKIGFSFSEVITLMENSFKYSFLSDEKIKSRLLEEFKQSLS
jgi:adenosine deaminase